LIATGFQKYGSQEELEKDPIKHLFEIYVKVNKDAEADPEVKAEAGRWFKRMEDGDESALKNWRVWRALSVQKYTEEYERLNIQFDVYTGESMVGKEWQDKALARLDEMGLIDDVDGAKIVNLEKWKMGKAVIRKRGAQFVCRFSLLTRDVRRDIHLPDSRHWRGNRAIRKVQVRQDDLRGVFAARSAPVAVFQSVGTDAIPVGHIATARQLWSCAGNEHAQRHSRVLGPNYQGGGPGYA
jgi:arginyl-tRNA synthetase